MAVRRYGTGAQKGSVHVIYDVAEYVEIIWIPNAGEEHGMTRQRSHSLYVVDDVGVSINYHDLKMLEQKGYLELRLE
ncbi:hypothetical protein C4585_02315 [Candidatus Parcubacteria bacterium]|nr:MAG: hypothetical protein C4585_02315 [Candidatus Parcubacteria bacterium]